MADRQIHPLDKSGIQPSREAHPLQGGLESGLCPQTHHVCDPNQLAPPVAFFHLAVDQTSRHLPLTQVPASTAHLEPVSKMGRQRVEVEIEPIAGEEWQTAGSQELPQGVDEQVRRMLGARAQMQHGHNLGLRIDGQPQPEHLSGAAQSGANFVQLQVREVQVAEAVLMEELSVLACASEPPGDGGLSVAEDPFSGGRVQSFGESRQHYGDLLRGSFQTVQRSVVSSAERGAARLAAKRLDALGPAMLAVPDQRIEVSISAAKVPALPVRTSEARGVDAFGGPPSAFHLTPGSHWRWPCSRRGSGGVTTGGAIIWGAGLEEAVERAALDPLLVRRKVEDGTSQDATAARGEGRPRAGTRRYEGA